MATNNDLNKKKSTASSKAKTNAKHKKKKTKRAVLIVEVVVVILLLAGLGLWMKFGQATFDETINMEDLEVNELDTETEELLSGYTTIAMFGVDNRDNGNYSSGNSDSMMVVSIDNATKEVNVVSVMRDTYLEVSDGTYRKSNYAYNHGGPEQAINCLNKNLDLMINAYVAVDFNALAKVVNDLGGLELTLTEDFLNATNPETGLPAFAGYVAEVQNVIYDGELDESKWYPEPGTQTLDGAQVVAYCRNRYSGGDDYGRTQRQREVVKLIVEKVINSNPATINKIVDSVLPDVSTSLTASQIISMATSASEYTINQTSGFPFALTTGTYGNKGSLVVPCTLEDNVVALHKFLYNQDDYVPSDTVKTISSTIQSDTGTSAESATVNQTNDGSEE